MDPRKEKQRDLRRAFAGGDRPGLYRMYDHLHPEDINRNLWCFRLRWLEYYYEYRNERDHWIKKQIGVFPNEIGNGMGNAPASYRRELNRQRRSKQKQAIRNAMSRQDWDDFDLPRFKRDVNWMWW